MNREYATIEVRAVDEEQRIIEGVANSATVDSFGTIIEPEGARYNLPLPLFFHTGGKHDHARTIGNVIETWVKDGKRWFKAHVPKIPDDGTDGGRDVMRRVDAAWADIKNGLVRGASIDFLPIKPPSPNAKRWTEWRWVGLTVVPMASNPDATIAVVRSILESPGLSGTSNPGPSGQPKTKDRSKPMTVQEQITQHEHSRAAKVARQEALMAAAGERSETLAANEAEEYDTLTQDIETIDEHLTRLNALKRASETAARPVNGNGSAAAAQTRSNGDGQQRGVGVVRVNQVEEPGLGFARYVQSLVVCQGNRHEAAEYARATWGEQGEGVALMHRAAVAAGTTTNATFAAPLVHTNYIDEFLALLRPKTLLGRIQGLRRVPFNTQMTVQTAGGTYSWVGQGVGKPVTNMQVAPVTLGIAKAAGIIVISEELARNSTPSAQGVVRDEMLAGMQQYLDTQFVDPAVAAVANVSPASITNGVAGTVTSGATEANIRTDVRTLVGNFAAANLDLGSLVILMGETLAFKAGTVVNSLGQRSFPGLSISGGEILGVPVVTSNVTPLQTRMVAVHAPSVMMADEGGTEISISREASIIMDSAPATVVQAAGAAPIHTSLWQNNLVGIRAERWINWGKARATAVDLIHTIAWA